MMAAPSGFEAQFQEFMYYAGSIFQLLYYAILPLVAIWAVLLFKRMVDFRTGSGKFANAGAVEAAASSAAEETSDDAGTAAAESTPIKVEKFVE